ncbi:MAG TPA: hypothetical protein VF549_12520 [Solirubrobacteraceae bacterium]
MSQLAELFLVRREHIGALLDAATPRRRLLRRPRDTFDDAFAALAEPLEVYEGSGIHVVAVLSYLAERGAPVLEGRLAGAAASLSEARQTTFFLFTASDERHLADLDPGAHDEAELRRYAEELYELADPAAGPAMRDALALLHRRVAALDDASALLLRVG